MSNVFRASRCTFCENFIREVGTPSPCSSCANYSRFILAKSFECCKKSCKEENTTLPSWTYFEWNHQFNFSACSIAITQSVCLDFTVRRVNNNLNTDKWEAYSELVNCVHDTQLSEEQIIFGVSRKEAIEKCNDAIKQMCNGFLELCKITKYR